MEFTGMRGILINDGKIIIMKRVKPDRLYYTFPGGHSNEGETAEECVVREWKEELDIDVKPIARIYNCTSLGKTQGYFLLEWISGTISKTDAEEYHKGADNISEPTWTDINEIENLPLMPPVVRQQLIKDLKEYKNLAERPLINLKDAMN